jgi:hypothetical protein
MLAGRVRKPDLMRAASVFSVPGRRLPAVGECPRSRRRSSPRPWVVMVVAVGMLAGCSKQGGDGEVGSESWPERPWTYLTANVPAPATPDVRVILLYHNDHWASFTTQDFKRLPDFEVELGQSVESGGYRFELLAVDEHGAFLRTYLPDGEAYWSADNPKEH